MAAARTGRLYSACGSLKTKTQWFPAAQWTRVRQTFQRMGWTSPFGCRPHRRTELPARGLFSPPASVAWRPGFSGASSRQISRGCALRFGVTYAIVYAVCAALEMPLPGRRDRPSPERPSAPYPRRPAADWPRCPGRASKPDRRGSRGSFLPRRPAAGTPERWRTPAAPPGGQKSAGR